MSKDRQVFLSLQSRSTGSGFIVDHLGHVVTNAHVVGYRGDVMVHLCDGRSFPGKVLAVDVSSDLALIRVWKFRWSIGEFIWRSYWGAMVAGTGVGFAIPVDQVRKFIQLALKASSNTRSSSPVSSASPTDPYILADNPTNSESGTQRRYLGLVMRTLTPELAFELASRGGQHFVELNGVLIHAVLRNSPAQKGLRAGDVIVAIDGLPITNAQQVYTATESREQLTITIVRQGKRITIDHIQTEKI
uniref:PDZ domain-containing protein n=1 Tax=Schistosoma curassoni TaxID=6186 RepID=A0A183K2S6_9TREM